MLAKAAKIFLGLWMIAVIVGTFTWLPPAIGFRNESLARILVFHVPNSIVASLASFASAYFALIYLIKRSPIDDIRSHASASVALVFWVLTTITGMVFAKVEWGVAWNWDPKQAGIFLLLLVYVSYFALRSAFSDETKRGVIAAAWTLFAGILAPFLTYVIPNSKGISSLHPKGVVFSMNGMSADYKIVFWSATLCILGLSYWMYRMQVDIDKLILSYRRRALRVGGAN